MPIISKSDCLIITASDSRYFDLVYGCLRSIRDKPESQTVNVAFLDLGCEPSQRAAIGDLVDHVREMQWPFDFPGRDQAPVYLRGMLARPFLREHFPGYSLYLWIDADAWVQDWQAINFLRRGAQHRRGLAIIPEIDRGALTYYGQMPLIWKEKHGWYGQTFGKVIADRLYSVPMLNAGVWAMHESAPHWQAWANELTSALARSVSLMTDQLALNVAVYARNLFEKTELLPAWCNWTCHFGFPLWDETCECFVERYLPWSPIGILHLTQLKAERAIVQSTSGKRMECSVRYIKNSARQKSPRMPTA